MEIYDMTNFFTFNEDKTILIKCDENHPKTEIAVPEGVRIINNWAFANCTWLTIIIIPKSVNYIKNQAFQNCTNLKTIIIKNENINIDLYAFAGCSNIEWVVMPHFNKNFLFTCFLDCNKLNVVSSASEIDIHNKMGVFDVLLSKAEELKQMSMFYHNRGMNLTMICGRQGDHYSYKEPLWKDGMDLEELFDSEQSTSLLLSQDWISASGIGMALGWNKYRAIDVDNLSRPEDMDNIIAKFLKMLELPEDYQWVVKSGSQKGFHIIIKVREFGERILRSHKSYSFSSFKEFERIEFRWKGHIVLPPSIHHTGNSYTFYNNRIPTEDVKYVELGEIDKLLYHYCGDNYFKTYKWNERICELVEERKITAISSDNSTVDEYGEDSIQWLQTCDTPQSNNSLAIRYVLGQEVPIDPIMAYELFKKADCNQSYFNIASLMSVGFFEGTKAEINYYLKKIDGERLHYHNEKTSDSSVFTISSEERIYEIQNNAEEYTNIDDIGTILQWEDDEFSNFSINEATFYKECKGYFSYTDFCKKYGEPFLQEDYDLGAKGLVINSDSQNFIISPPSDKNALTLIDLTKSLSQITEELREKADNLVVVINEYPFAQPTRCSLCDKYMFDVFKYDEYVLFCSYYNEFERIGIGREIPFRDFCKSHGAPIVRRFESKKISVLYCRDEDGYVSLIIPSQVEGTLTLIDFSKSTKEIAKAIIEHADNLIVKEGNRESDGSPYYVLIDNPKAKNRNKKDKVNKPLWYFADKDPFLNQNYHLFFDTETTGLPRNYKAPSLDTQNWPRLVQLAWILTDEEGNRIHTGNLIVKPDGFVIPADAAKVHGITTQKAEEEGVSLAEAIEQFKADLGIATYIVGHNVDFDKKIVGTEMIRLGMKDEIEKKKSYCTMQSSIDLCKISGNYGYKYPKLQELYKKLFGKDFEGAHNAMSDIEATEKCFWELKKRKLI